MRRRLQGEFRNCQRVEGWLKIEMIPSDIVALQTPLKVSSEAQQILKGRVDTDFCLLSDNGKRFFCHKACLAGKSIQIPNQ